MRSRDVYVIGGLGVFLVVATACSLWAGILETSSAIGALATLLAAFLGAYFAFALNEQRELRKVHDEQKVALNRSLFVLARQINAIENYYFQAAPFSSPHERAFSMPAFKPPSYAELAHDFDRLAFLLDSSESQLLMDLTVEQERFEQVIESIRIRNEFYVGEIQPAMIEHGLTGRPFTFEELYQALGERLVCGAMDGSKNVWEHLEGSRKSLPEMHKKLLGMGRKLFPGESLVMWNTEA
ncbi:hypothetical protein [Halomonas sp. Mc5H-6]|uniref:hypothetical protein n=1 Tax=Halomonas sp. Mc5H-6 TaxID=2954500 RepID=UPI0020980F5B|nr:hypothetical protein [Halomonas sp. Mc5H-6]MCO7247740.1 hypothetical protein [Halomonas sp. Mc5H-6]